MILFLLIILLALLLGCAGNECMAYLEGTGGSIGIAIFFFVLGVALLIKVLSMLNL